MRSCERIETPTRDRIRDVIRPCRRRMLRLKQNAYSRCIPIAVMQLRREYRRDRDSSANLSNGKNRRDAATN